MLLLAPLPFFEIRALVARATYALSKIVRRTKLSRSIGNAAILRLDGSRRYKTLHCCLCFDLNGTKSMLKDYSKKGEELFKSLSSSCSRYIRLSFRLMHSRPLANVVT